MISVYFLDTSALVKKYMTEKGSEWIGSLTDIDSENQIILARVTWVETVSAFARLQRENKINPQILQESIQIFKSDWETQFQIVEIEKSDFEKAGDIVQKYPLRAYDSVQLACALKIYSVFATMAPHNFIFISADNRLLSSAESEGLKVDNPNNYL